MNFKTFIFFFLFPFSLAQAQSLCHADECPVTEEVFDQTMDRFRNLYPRVRFITPWDDDRPQAAASFRRLIVSGGFARKNDINVGGLITVTCHEVGHALFSLNEGEADDFATRECMPFYYEGLNNLQVAQNFKQISPEAMSLCDNEFNPAASAICQRIFVGAINAAQADANRCVSRMESLIDQVTNSNQQFFRIQEFYYRCLRTIVSIDSPSLTRTRLLSGARETLNRLLTPLDFNEKDQRIVERAYSAHNSPLCRLQTLIDGVFAPQPPPCWFR
ncbi:MAG: hypothetical protein AAF203_05350 [Pseudomonadota bacterium]